MNQDRFNETPQMAADATMATRRLAILIGVILCFIADYLLITSFSYGQIADFIMLIAAVFVTLWTFTARSAWWLVMPVTLSFGGFFYFGFKILLHELGLALCLLPIPFMAAVLRRPTQRRAPLPFSAYLLFAYMAIHLVISLYTAKVNGLSGGGHIVRVYMQGLWPVVFLIVFHLFGQTNLLKQAFIAMYVACLARILLGLTAFFFPAFLYVPGVNFVLPATDVGFSDLRTSALLFASLNLCYASMSRVFLRTAFHVVMVGCAGVLTLMGSGRVSFLIFCTVTLLLAMLRRKMTVLMALLCVLLATATYLNRNPEVLFNAPERVRRPLSALVIDSPQHDVHREVRLSNRWHFELGRMGRERWLASPLTFLFGNHVSPFSEDYYTRTGNMEARMEIAAGIGSYESGLWTMLAVLGLAGTGIYAVLFGRLLKGLVREVRLNGIRDYEHAFYFLALSTSATWLLFCWISGHFPSMVLFFCTIAYAALEDQKRRAAEAAPVISAPAPSSSAIS